MCQRPRIFLPISAVEGRVINRVDRLGFYTADIHTYAVSIRAWDVKRLNAALAAKIMLREATTESVERQRLFAFGKGKPAFRYE